MNSEWPGLTEMSFAVRYSTADMHGVGAALEALSHQLRTQARQLRFAASVTAVADVSTRFERVTELTFALQSLAHQSSQTGAALVSAADHIDECEAAITARMRAGELAAQVSSLLSQSADDLLTASLGLAYVGRLATGGKNDACPDQAAGALSFILGILANPFNDVRVERVSRQTVQAPSSLSDLATRIPNGGEDSAQIKIEKYGAEDQPRWVVYIGGTVTMDLFDAEEPFNNASNVSLMATGHSSSLEATTMAMTAAGVAAEDEVTFVGFSQGGMVAAELAQQSTNRVVDVVTLGSPVAHIDLSNARSVIAIEESSDPVPRLSGVDAIVPLYADNRLVLRGSLPIAPTDLNPFTSHSLQNYQQLVTGFERTHAQSITRKLSAPLASLGPSGQAETWRAVRD